MAIASRTEHVMRLLSKSFITALRKHQIIGKAGEVVICCSSPVAIGHVFRYSEDESADITIGSVRTAGIANLIDVLARCFLL